MGAHIAERDRRRSTLTPGITVVIVPAKREDVMRMRPTVYRGLLLSLFLALGIALGAPSAAWAQAGPWTTVASAGTADAASLKILTLDGPFAFNSNTGSVATIRYNVVALDNVSGGLPANQDTGFMVVRYRDDGLAAVVRLELIE